MFRDCNEICHFCACLDLLKSHYRTFQSINGIKHKYLFIVDIFIVQSTFKVNKQACLEQLKSGNGDIFSSSPWKCGINQPKSNI